MGIGIIYFDLAQIAKPPTDDPPKSYLEHLEELAEESKEVKPDAQPSTPNQKPD